MKNSEIQELSTQEIIEKVEDEKALIVRQRLNHTVSPLDNPHQITQTRRLIARLKTELRRRAISEEK